MGLLWTYSNVQVLCELVDKQGEQRMGIEPLQPLRIGTIIPPEPDRAQIDSLKAEEEVRQSLAICTTVSLLIIGRQQSTWTNVDACGFISLTLFSLSPYAFCLAFGFLHTANPPRQARMTASPSLWSTQVDIHPYLRDLSISLQSANEADRAEAVQEGTDVGGRDGSSAQGRVWSDFPPSSYSAALAQFINEQQVLGNSNGEDQYQRNLRLDEQVENRTGLTRNEIRAIKSTVVKREGLSETVSTLSPLLVKYAPLTTSFPGLMFLSAVLYMFDGF